MSVKVEIPEPLRSLINCQEEVVEVAGYNVLECLENLAVRFPDIKRWLYNEQGELFPYINIYVNAERDPADELTKPLKDGDKLLILLMVGGG